MIKVMCVFHNFREMGGMYFHNFIELVHCIV
jgi:hypothetical protein